MQGKTMQGKHNAGKEQCRERQCGEGQCRERTMRGKDNAGKDNAGKGQCMERKMQGKDNAGKDNAGKDNAGKGQCRERKCRKKIMRGRTVQGKTMQIWKLKALRKGTLYNRIFEGHDKFGNVGSDKSITLHYLISPLAYYTLAFLADPLPGLLVFRFIADPSCSISSKSQANSIFSGF